MRGVRQLHIYILSAMTVQRQGIDPLCQKAQKKYAACIIRLYVSPVFLPGILVKNATQIPKKQEEYCSRGGISLPVRFCKALLIRAVLFKLAVPVHIGGHDLHHSKSRLAVALRAGDCFEHI